MTRPHPALLAATAALLCLIWGTTWSAIQIGLAGIPPFSGVALRFAIAATLVGGIALARRVPLGRTARERRLWLANGVLSFFLSYGIVYWAEQWVPSGLTAVLFATYPLFVAVLAHFALPEEGFAAREAVGLLVGFGGVGLIFSSDFDALGGSRVAFAAALLLVSPFVSAVASVAVKRWGHGIHPLSLTAVPMAISVPFAGTVALLTEREATFEWSGSAIGALLYLAVIGSAVTFTLYYWLLAHLPAKRVALIAYVIPVVAVAIGSVRGEPFTARSLLGSLLVVGGVALAVHRAR